LKVLTHDYYILMMKIMIFKCTVYYQQAIAQILLSNPAQISIRSFVFIFLLSVITTIANNDKLWCLYQGMNDEEKIL